MTTVKRANVILTIEDDEVDKYYEKGYSVIDEFGNVLKASAPTEVGALQRALYDAEVEIAELKKQIEKLKAENNVFGMALNSKADDAQEVKPEKKTNKKKAQEQ